MRLPRGTVAPIIFLWCGALTSLGCGKLASHDDGGHDGGVDLRSDDVAIADASDAGSADVDASPETGAAPMDASAEATGDAEVGCVPDSESFATTVTCPIDATAVAGVVTPTCEFSHSLAPNNVFTGPVMLVSHLDRDFAAFDVNPIGDGRIQLMCDYADADGLGIGGIYRFIVASSCAATSAASFTCTQ
jgi:hypothetical protein